MYRLHQSLFGVYRGVLQGFERCTKNTLSSCAQYNTDKKTLMNLMTRTPMMNHFPIINQPWHTTNQQQRKSQSLSIFYRTFTHLRWKPLFWPLCSSARLCVPWLSREQGDRIEWHFLNVGHCPRGWALLVLVNGNVLERYIFGIRTQRVGVILSKILWLTFLWPNFDSIIFSLI